MQPMGWAAISARGCCTELTKEGVTVLSSESYSTSFTAEVVDADGKKHFKSEKSNPTCEMCIIRAAGFGMERMLGRAYNVTAKNIGYIPSHAHNVSKSPKKGRNP